MKGQRVTMPLRLNVRITKQDQGMIDDLSNAWGCNWSEVIRRLVATAHAEHHLAMVRERKARRGR